MKALVTKPCSINEVPAKAGDLVEVDANTLENLTRKGLLKEAPVEAPETPVDEKNEEPTGRKSKNKDA